MAEFPSMKHSTTSPILSSLLALSLAAPVLMPSAHAAQRALHHKPRKTPLPQAASGPLPTAPLAVPGVPAPPALDRIASYVLMDATTGAVIAEKSDTQSWPPASLTKLMTAYLTYKAIAAKTLKMDQSVPVSTKAWRTGGSRMFISPTTPVTVDQLLHGLIIDSGNDAAVALAQAVAGTRAAFVAQMNDEAVKLHLVQTHYTNVSGLPDPALNTSALDTALLSRAMLTDYPQILQISVKKHYVFNKIRQRSWNPVLFHDSTVDGLKTGRTDEAGHCIDATAMRNGRRLIAVVLGGPNWAASTSAVEALLSYGYQFYGNTIVATAGKPVGQLQNPNLEPVMIPVGAAQTITVTMPVIAAKTLKTTVAFSGPFNTGVTTGATVGTVTVSANGKTLATVPAIALATAKPAGVFTKLMRRFHKII
jgi:D-alanyl-D-alanine carboxypeptidase (penicillin-binding protein 5/6)